MAKKPIHISCVGVARYPYLNKPSYQFDAEGTYKVELEVDPSDPATQAFLKFLDAEAAKHDEGATKVQRPFKKKDDNYIVNFKTSYAPRLFDAYNNKLPAEVNIGSGSRIKVAYQVNFYKGFGGGVNLYLQAAQVLELVEFKGRDAEDYGFAQEEGFKVEDQGLPENGYDFSGEGPETESTDANDDPSLLPF